MNKNRDDVRLWLQEPLHIKAQLRFLTFLLWEMLRAPKSLNSDEVEEFTGSVRDQELQAEQRRFQSSQDKCYLVCSGSLYVLDQLSWPKAQTSKIPIKAHYWQFADRNSTKKKTTLNC